MSPTVIRSFLGVLNHIHETCAIVALLRSKSS